ncbi:MAG: oligosaccharide flippase family protein [Pseudomonadota bacterium]
MQHHESEPSARPLSMKNMFSAATTLGTSIIIKMACGLFLIKLLALRLPVTEFGQMGQYMTLIAFLTAIAGGGQIHGLIKLLGESKPGTIEWTELLQTAHFQTFIASGAIMLILVFGALPLTEYLVGRPELVWIMAPVCIGLFFAGLNNINIAAMSATGAMRDLASSQVMATLIATAATAALLWIFGLPGAATGFALTAFWNFVLSHRRTKKLELIQSFDRRPVFNPALLKALFSYSGAFLVAILFMPLSYMFVRAELASIHGWKAVGQWQAVHKLSEAVMQIYGTFLNNFVLAHMARVKSYNEIRSLLINVTLAVVGSAILGYTVLYIGRDLAVSILFTSEFKPITGWLHVQFAGDVLCLVAAIASNFFIARKLLWRYIMVQASAAAFFVYLFSMFAAEHGFAAPIFAHLYTFGILAVCFLGLALFSEWTHRKTVR